MAAGFKDHLPDPVRQLVRRIRFRLRHGGPVRTFQRIYQDNYWQDPEAESVSGWGSSTSQTQLLVEALPSILGSVGTKSVLDIPCGDFAWMRRVERSGFTYTGADIVPQLVEQNRREFGDERTSFRLLDLTSDALPAVDVVLVRDCLVHLSEPLVWAAIDNIRRSGSRHLLTTTYPERAENRNVPTGRWRPLNLEVAPFGFPPPVHAFLEGCTEHDGTRADKTLALWEVSSLPRTPLRIRLHPRWLATAMKRTRAR